ncbi:DUF3109 family protein [Porphyromonadaceae bacterium W3.11]|nr:DUF3109 family protein [Porphyromonadaceae bacterium W3.11]
MIIIDDVIVSTDVLETYFECDLEACKGACCVEGESGAPILEVEEQLICKAYPSIESYLSQKNKSYIEDRGLMYTDLDGDMVTNIIEGKECVFTTFEKDGSARCAFEKACSEGRNDTLYKPISCHLFPVRVQQLHTGQALNYVRWRPICEPARENGKRNGIRLYRFLEAPLIRAYGEEWYGKLLEEAEEYFRNKEKGDERK